MTDPVTPLPTLDDVLARREARAARHHDLLAERHMPLVSLTVVVPGPDKNLPWVDDVFAAGVDEVRAEIAAQEWPVWWAETYEGPTGPELLLAVDGEPRDIKRALVAVEESHEWGRLWDIDVIADADMLGIDSDAERIVLSRADLGLPTRRCLLCHRPSPECARARRHALDDLHRGIARIIDGSVGRIADAAHRALVREAHLTPKPGLVDERDAGSHDDMTLTTFDHSAAALRPFWSTFALAGSVGADLAELQEIGRAAEDAMHGATAGVNTHKGAIFSLGALCAAAGADPDGGVDAWCARVADWVGPELARWQEAVASRGAQTHGERAWVEHGMTGARGMAADGFLVVRQAALPAYRERLAEFDDVADALRWTLVALMAHVPDTNVFTRGGADGVDFVTAWAEGVLASAPSPVDLVDAMTAANREFRARRLSPGGAADLLAVTLFLHLMEA